MSGKLIGEKMFKDNIFYCNAIVGGEYTIGIMKNVFELCSNRSVYVTLLAGFFLLFVIFFYLSFQKVHKLWCKIRVLI
jgi:hypothetical protein